MESAFGGEGPPPLRSYFSIVCRGQSYELLCGLEQVNFWTRGVGIFGKLMGPYFCNGGEIPRETKRCINFVVIK